MQQVRIAIFFSSHAVPDEHVASEVFSALSKNDRFKVTTYQSLLHKESEWQRVEVAIRETDYLIVFLSESSIKSEFISDVIEVAHDYKRQTGHPIILPVRLAYREPLQYPIAAYLNSITWAFWDRHDDTHLLIEELLRAVSAKDPEPSTVAKVTSQPLPDPVGFPPEPIHFTAYYPTELRPEIWYSLLVYAHIQSALGVIEADSRNLTKSSGQHYRSSRNVATQNIERGALITVVPEMPGCRFNPPRASLLLLEDWHRVEFRMQALSIIPGFELDTATNGRIAFYVGPILVAEIKFWAHFANNTPTTEPNAKETAEPYQSVFVSYSHKDIHLVQMLEEAYRVLGIKYLRDVNSLRSGEEWNPALLKMIEGADIFQLCWSNAARQSAYVEQEWRHAITMGRTSFIRPVYWEIPMPETPPELSAIHFAYLPTAPSSDFRF